MKNSGFTLIEVLVAVLILSLSITGILINIQTQARANKLIQDKIIRHWVSKQALAMYKLRVINQYESQAITRKTTLFGNTWFWRIKIIPLTDYNIHKVNILTSKNNAKNFQLTLSGYDAPA